MTFETEKTVKYWLESGEYDLTVAQSLYEKRKYPYSLFFGHLALEKLLKAVYVKSKKQHAPFTHSLPLLAEKSGINIPKEILIKLREFMEFYFEARYPDEQKSFYKKCTRKYTTQKLKGIEEVFKWLREQLQS
jgi:HEPN domain-containing protein